MERFFYLLESFLERQISRRKFLKLLFGGLAAYISQSKLVRVAFAKVSQSEGRPKSGIKGIYDLVEVKGKDPYENTVRGVEAMGGIERFVRKGSTVVVKPNIAWDRTPEQAADTNPQVVAALVEMCYKAGARRVNVFDVTCNEERLCYQASGIAKAAAAKGAYVYFPNLWNIVNMKFKYESPMEGWPVLRDALNCDTLINVPVLKDHGLTNLTLSMKNLMGVCAGTRGEIHQDIGRKLVDLTDFISPDLTVIDATRVLIRNGPTGGDLNDVITLDKIIVATDPTLADTFACTLVNRDPMDVPYIKVAIERHFGSADIQRANILRLT